MTEIVESPGRPPKSALNVTHSVHAGIVQATLTRFNLTEVEAARVLDCRPELIRKARTPVGRGGINRRMLEELEEYGYGKLNSELKDFLLLLGSHID
jgi:hypothetical protein